VVDVSIVSWLLQLKTATDFYHLSVGDCNITHRETRDDLTTATHSISADCGKYIGSEITVSTFERKPVSDNGLKPFT